MFIQPLKQPVANMRALGENTIHVILQTWPTNISNGFNEVCTKFVVVADMLLPFSSVDTCYKKKKEKKAIKLQSQF